MELKAKDITILVSFFKPKENEIEYWQHIKKILIEKNIQIHFLIDNPNLKIEGENVYKNFENLGKFRTVYNHIKDGNVKTKLFKTFDPDDFLNIESFLETKLFDGEVIYRMKSFRSKIIPENFFDIDYDSLEKENPPFRYDNFGTSWTILPTNGIYEDKYFSGEDIRINEDQLLGMLCYVWKNKIVDVDFWWYLYIEENGVSNPKYFETYLNNLEVTLREKKRIVNKTGINPPIDWPGSFGYYSILKKKYETEFGENENINSMFNFLYEKYKEE